VKIERYPSLGSSKPMTIEKFADKYNLIMEVHQRAPLNFYAHFKDVQIVEEFILVGAFGDGKTEKSAIASYAARISGKVITVDGCKTRIQVPTLIYKHVGCVFCGQLKRSCRCKKP